MTIPNALPTLSAGAHRPDEGKACVMEYVSLLAGEEWSDIPACTYRPLAKAAQVVNDSLSDADRHRLVPLIGRLFGTTLPVDDRLFALRVARTVEHLSPSAKACNDVTERVLLGDAIGRGVRSTTAAGAYAYAAAADAAYAAAAGACAAADACAAAAAVGADRDLVAWLESVIDIYDELSGRTEHHEITDAELTELALAVRR